MSQPQEHLRQAVADLLSDSVRQEQADQANHPITNGTSTNLRKIFGLYRDSPHLEWIYHQLSGLGQPGSDNGTNRSGHLRGLVHEGTGHLLVRALLQEGRDRRLVVLSPQITTDFTKKFKQVLVDQPNDDGEEPLLLSLEADSLIVNSKKMIVQEDIEYTLRKSLPAKKTEPPNQVPNYFDSKQVRFETARDDLPILFTNSAVCRFVLTKGQTLGSKFVPPRNAPYTGDALDEFTAHLIHGYRPEGENLRPLIDTCSGLEAFVGQFLAVGRKVPSTHSLVYRG